MYVKNPFGIVLSHILGSIKQNVMGHFVKRLFLGEVLGLYLAVKVIHESLLSSNMQRCKNSG